MSIFRGELHLSDETGSRRFLIFGNVEQIDIDNLPCMDDVYRQAYHLYETGFEYWFGGQDIAAINKRNMQYMIPTTEEEYIDRHFEPAEVVGGNIVEVPGKESTWVSSAFIADYISKLDNYPVSGRSPQLYGQALTKLKYNHRVRHGSKKEYAVYLKK